MTRYDRDGTDTNIADTINLVKKLYSIKASKKTNNVQTFDTFIEKGTTCH